MPVFSILIILGLIILWFLLSPLFNKIGNSVTNKMNEVFSTDEIKENNKSEKETKEL
jgi:hypothetical protein